MGPPHLEFDELQRDSESWWYATRRKLLREAAAQAVRGKREADVLDLGCTAQLRFDDPALYRVCNVQGSLRTLAFRQIEGDRDLVCSRPEELAFASNSFDAIVAGDVLQSVADDVSVLREMRRVLKEGGLLCLTAPAYSFLWGEDDEARGHQRRYTVSELRRKLTTCGFQIHRASYFVASAFLPLVVGRAAKDVFRKSISAASALPAPVAPGERRHDGVARWRAPSDALHQSSVWDASRVLGTETGAGGRDRVRSSVGAEVGAASAGAG